MPTLRQICVLVGVAIVIALILRATTTRRPRAADETQTYMPLAAAEAVKVAAARGVALDYSPASVERVEAILADLHRAGAAGEVAERDLHRHALQFGAYVGEVIRRRFGGRWAEDSDVAGSGTFPLHWDGGQSFPVGWCGKRLFNGEEDDVWVKFQIVTSDEYRHLPTTRPGD